MRPFVDARIKIGNRATKKTFDSKIPMRVFIDSGSSHTIIPPAALSVLEDEIGPLKLGKAKVKTASGFTDALVVEDASFCLANCCFTGPLLVMEDIPADVMIGTDFLVSTKAKIDFQKGTLKCDGLTKKIKFTMLKGMKRGFGKGR